MGFDQTEVFVARITRKELKSDKFALEVGQTVSFFEEHRQEFLRYGAIAAGVAVLVAGWLVYRHHQRGAREEALAMAITLQEGSVGQPTGRGMNFPTQAAKDETTAKVFTNLATKYSGTVEGDVAQYYLGAISADASKMKDAEAHFQQVAEHGDSDVASLAKYSLAQIYFATGRESQGEQTMRDLIAHPTIMVSADQATISLARYIAAKRPDEARKLLDPLRRQTTDAGRAAMQLAAQLPQ
jgi:predicted negative regulator of RcsB-dependent stress response